MSILIQLKRGLKANAPATGSSAEPIFATDTKEFGVWDGSAWAWFKNYNDIKTYVDLQVNNLVNAAPGALDTLKELADALGNDANYATTVTNALNALDGRIDALEAHGGETLSSHELWVSTIDGLDANTGKNSNSPVQTLAVAMPLAVSNTVVNLAFGSYADTFDIASLQSVVVKGVGQLGKVHTVLAAGQVISGTSSRCGFENVNVGSSSIATALTISASGGLHVFDNIGANNNTAPAFIQHGTACHSANPLAPKVDAKYINLDMTTVTGEIVLPDLGTGEYAMIQIIDSIGAKVKLGSGWFVAKSRSYLDTFTYTGTASVANIIDMDALIVSDSSSIDFTYNPLTKAFTGEVTTVDGGTF